MSPDPSAFCCRAQVIPRPGLTFPTLPLPYLSTCYVTNERTALLVSLFLVQYLSINHLTALFCVSQCGSCPFSARSRAAAFQQLTGAERPAGNGQRGQIIPDNLGQIQFMHFFSSQVWTL